MTDIIARSLYAAFLATIIVGPIGCAVGYVLARRRIPLRPVVDAVVALPLVLPPVAIGVLLLQIVSARSGFGRALADAGLLFVGEFPGVVLCASVMGLPLIIRSAESAFAATPLECEEAARSLGATRTRTILSIALPLAIGGVASGFFLVFARALGEFGATMVVAGYAPGRTDTLALAIYHEYLGADRSLVTALLVASILLCMAATLAARLVQRGAPRTRWTPVFPKIRR